MSVVVVVGSNVVVGGDVFGNVKLLVMSLQDESKHQYQEKRKGEIK